MVYRNIPYATIPGRQRSGVDRTSRFISFPAGRGWSARKSLQAASEQERGSSFAELEATRHACRTPSASGDTRRPMRRHELLDCADLLGRDHGLAMPIFPAPAHRSVPLVPLPPPTTHDHLLIQPTKIPANPVDGSFETVLTLEFLGGGAALLHLEDEPTSLSLEACADNKVRPMFCPASGILCFRF